MAFSTQRAVSDGTLTDIILTIQYIDKEDVNVFIDDVPQVDGVDYNWITDTLIRFVVAVPNGLEVLLQRSTDLSKVLNIFTQGATFDDPTMDENFRQMLYIAQEAREGATLEEIFNNLNMHGYKVQNMGPGTEPGDAITYQQYVDDSLGAGNARAGAEAARDDAVAARDAAQGYANTASTAATNAGNSATAANTSATNAANSATTAGTHATNAGNSATAANTSATNAATSASSASTSATNAAASATAAASNLLPVGGIHQYPSRVSIPAGFGAADGVLVNRATYPDLWALVNNGTFPSVSDATWLADPLERGKYSTGDGTTTFRIPDYNGVQAGSIGGLFFRGSSTGAGAVLRDAIQNITGSFRMASDRATGVAGPVTGAFNASTLAAGDSDGRTGGSVVNSYNVAFDASAVVRTAAETRPMQVAGVWIIKMFGSAVNPGTVDITQLAADVVALTGRIQTLETRPAYSAQIALSGTAPAVTGVPSWPRRIRVYFETMSTSGAAAVLFQVGTSAGYVTTGYAGSSSTVAASTAGSTGSTAGALLDPAGIAAATNQRTGFVELVHMGGNKWLINHRHSMSSTPCGVEGSYIVTLPGVLDRFRFIATGGTETFDSGNMMSEYNA